MTSRRTLRVRIAATAGLFIAVFVLLAARAVQITVMEGETLRYRAGLQHKQSISLLAQRGTIVDRHGEPLALTRESMAVYVRPKQVTATAEPLAAVARLLDKPADVVAGRATEEASFVWLDRRVPLDRWEEIERLGITGIGGEPTWQRVYPHGALAGHLLGFTGIDGQGLEGVERRLDAELRGEAEALDFERDAWGRRIAVEDGWRPLPRVGARVELTIDADLQEVAEAELEGAVEEFQAVAGSALVMVPRTGEVLAMATVPRFDPNDYRHASPEIWRNRAITDSYEPGSTFKAILAAAALEEGVVRPDDRIFCEDGAYAVGRRVIHDHDRYGTLTFADVIAFSSNIGAGKVAERLGAGRFGAAIRAFGFGERTGIDLPGEVPGLVLPSESWRRINLITNAFGQGIAVTPLQLARAFAAFANGGMLMRPYVVRRVVDEGGTVRWTGRPHIDRRVVSESTARQLAALLQRVVESGTGKQAAIAGVPVAGKTGTSQKVDPKTKRYHPRDRIASFVGFVPADDPELVVLVVIDSPKKAKYGGVVAAPAFRRIAEHGLTRRGALHRDPRHPPAFPPELDALNLVAVHVEEPVDDGGMPSFLGLGMREALVRARELGWRIRIEGSGYVVSQEPPPGGEPPGDVVRLTFGSAAS